VPQEEDRAIHLKTLTLAAAAAFTMGCSEEAPPVAGAVQCQAHDVGEIRGGYAVAVADFNNDGRLDVMANALGLGELVWHENPTWDRHVIVAGVSSLVNLAIADTDGDSDVPPVAVPLAMLDLQPFVVPGAEAS